jgi:hypothetical protein
MTLSLICGREPVTSVVTPSKNHNLRNHKCLLSHPHKTCFLPKQVLSSDTPTRRTNIRKQTFPNSIPRLSFASHRSVLRPLRGLSVRPRSAGETVGSGSCGPLVRATTELDAVGLNPRHIDHYRHQCPETKLPSGHKNTKQRFSASVSSSRDTCSQK